MAGRHTAVKGIHHVGLSVADVERALGFYQSVTPLERVDRAGVVDRAVVLRAPNAYLEMSATPRADMPVMPVEGPGVTHICFQSPASTALYSSFIDVGAAPVSTGDAPIDLNGTGVRYGYARDPDGVMFEVEQLDDPKFSDPMWLAHVALASPDIDRLVEFYETVIGIEPYGRVNKVTGPRVDEVTGLDDARARAAWFNCGNMILEAWEYLSPRPAEMVEPRPADGAGYSRVVFEVADLDDQIERLTDAGLGFGPIAATGGSRLAFARDPDLNLIGFLELEDGSDASIDRLKRIDWM